LKIGIALGSGGARGLAHIVLLEVFEELQISPAIISGSSMGALVGGAFCAGLSTRDIRESLNEILKSESSKIWNISKNFDYFKLLDFLDLGIGQGGILKGDKFYEYYKNRIGVENFNQLKIPLKVVATNYYTREQSIFDEGEILQPIKASYAVPGLLPPVKINNNLYIDGGMVNPLPYDIITDHSDFTIAIDVSSSLPFKDGDNPPLYETFFSSFQIMQNSILSAKLKTARPNILIQVKIKNVRMMDFINSAEVLKQASEFKKELTRKLDKLLTK